MSTVPFSSTIYLSVHSPKHKTFIMQSSSRLMEFKVKDLMVNKRRLVQVPNNATLADALNTMVIGYNHHELHNISFCLLSIKSY